MSAPLVIPFRNRRPLIDDAAWVAPTAVIIGDTEIASQANVWCAYRTGRADKLLLSAKHAGF